MAKKAKPRLVCPKCGWDGTDDGMHDFCFRYLEEVTSERRVEGFNDAGVLEISGEDHIAIEDDGTSHRLRCGDCLAEFAIPEGIKLDFV